MKLIVNIFTAVRARPFAMALLLYQVLFFNVFLPGHTRGSITLSGKHTADSSPCCCCCCGHENPDTKKSDSKQVPSQRDKEECAICHFAARVLPTPVVSFVLPELGLLETRPLVSPSVPVPADLVRTYLSRGPPALI
jgi:hypothetical protein